MRWLLVLLVSGCGFEPRGEKLVPRLVAPLSTAQVSSPRPTLRFVLPPSLGSPVVEICRDRACAGPILSATVEGLTARPDAPLANGWWFWRVRVGSALSATWQLRVTTQSEDHETAWGSALDLDGDGLTELAVGAPYAGEGARAGDGKVYLYRGHADGPDGTRLTVLDSPEPGALFGHALATVDFDGDGYADLAVGAPRGGTFDNTAMGRLFLYRGGPEGVHDTPDATVTVGDLSDFGWALAAAGDVNGDGYGDLVAGAPTTTRGGRIVGGAVIVHGDAVKSQLLTSLDPETASLTNSGAEVAGGGDLDGDGLGDVLVGAPGAANGSGHVWLYHSGAVVTGPDLLDVGAPPMSHFGYSIEVRGDVDGDGLSDLAVGAPDDGPGRVHLFSGVSRGVPVHTGQLDGPDGDGGRFGAEVAAGDPDGDGQPDLAIGAICVEQTVDCIGRAYLYSAAGSMPYLAPAGTLSYGVALSLSDFDEDGLDDLAIGASESSAELGRVDWFHDGAPPARALNGAVPGGRFGFVLR